MNIPRVFIFLGRSGSGKGTQSDLLDVYLKENSFISGKALRVESGTLLREFGRGESFSHQKIKTALTSGTLAPEAIIVSLWTDFLIKNFTGTQAIIFDGCPRKLREAELLNDVLDFYNITILNVILLDVSVDWSADKLTGRGRSDDTPEAIKKRLAWFETDVTPVLNYFEKNKKYNFIRVNGEQTIPEVHAEIVTKLRLK